MLKKLTHLTKTRRTEIREFAEDILFEYDCEVPCKIVKLSKEMGFKVFKADLGEDIRAQTNDKKIYVSNKDDTKRHRLSIAHELGYFLLNKNKHNKNKHNLYRHNFNNDENEKELEARFFATNLLMPKYEVFELYRLGFGLESMADYFNVPKSAMAERINYFKG